MQGNGELRDRRLEAPDLQELGPIRNLACGVWLIRPRSAGCIPPEILSDTCSPCWEHALVESFSTETIYAPESV